ncbi:MAG: LicD family protein [Reichenbachiella sp.]
MDFISIIQKIKRFYYIVLTTLPHNYQKKRLIILEDLFKKSNQYLLDNHIDYWLDFGTLLGYYREKKIIPHDMDVDYGCLEPEYEKLKSTQKKLPPGLTLHDSSYRHHGLKMYFNYKGFDADVYFYEEDNGMLTSGVRNSLPNECTPFNKSLVIPTSNASFLDRSTFVPAETKNYLVHIYNYLGKKAVKDKKTGYFYKRD